jgi:carbonic anhydrase
MSTKPEIQSANETYAASFDKGHLPMPPGRRFAVVTCMDARLDPAKFLGLDEGDAHVIRNAGGIVTDDALRSLVISHNLLGTEEVFVIAHTDCGMLTFSNEELQEQLGTDIEFLPFSDPDASVRASVERVRESPICGESVHGFVYEVETGRLREVA